MKEFLTSLFGLNGVDCEILAALLYMFPQEKRSHFAARLASGIVLCLAFVPLTGILQQFSIGVMAADALALHPVRAAYTVLLDILLNLLPAFLLILWCCRLRLKMAVYVGVFAFLTQDIAYTLFCILFPEGAHRGRLPAVLPEYIPAELAVMAVVFAVFYAVFARRLLPTRGDNIDSSNSVLFLVAILLVGQIISVFMKFFFVANDQAYVRYILIYDLLLALTILGMQVLVRREETFRAKAEMEAELRAMEQHNYESHKTSMDAVNHLSHDLKYVVSAAAAREQGALDEAYLKQIEQTVAEYDTQVHTGNTALDTLLTDTGLRCNAKNISWTCMADGSALDFFTESDLFIFAGNALSNAIEACEQVPEEERRHISVNVWKKGGLSFFRVANTCGRAPVMKNGVPQTTKQDKVRHGYGTQSILSLAEKYGGDVTFSLEDDLFILNAVFPVS